MSDYVLELRDVTKRYDGFTLDHVSFCVSHVIIPPAKPRRFS